MGKGGTSSFATKGADATAGNLTTLHDGSRPKGYQPMHKTGAIILGVGGDNLASRQGGELAGGREELSRDRAIQSSFGQMCVRMHVNPLTGKKYRGGRHSLDDHLSVLSGVLLKYST